MRSVHCLLLASVGLLLAAVPAAAQEDLARGKTVQQMFNTDCAICHRSVRGLGTSMGPLSLPGFLLEHYTTSRAVADALAGYVTAVGAGGPEPPRQQRRRPRAAKPAKPGKN